MSYRTRREKPLRNSMNGTCGFGRWEVFYQGHEEEKLI